jgi:hypothetical protein
MSVSEECFAEREIFLFFVLDNCTLKSFADIPGCLHIICSDPYLGSKGLLFNFFILLEC